jgi:hypothetical protein
MEISHSHEQGTDHHNTTQYGRRNRPFVDRDLKDFEDDPTEGDIGQEH